MQDPLFDYSDNFKKTESVESIPVFESGKGSPLFTIAIPTCKRAGLLKEAIESAINQNGSHRYDIIVVDDNPERNDGTELLMKDYAGAPNISYYKNAENIGAANNWNRLYKLSRGEYVVMLHDDDMLYPDYLDEIERLVRKTKHRYDAIFVQYNVYDARKNGNIPLQIDERAYPVPLYLRDFLFGNVVGVPVGMCVKRQVLFGTGGFNDLFHPSMDFHMAVKLACNYRICRLYGKMFAVYRILENESLLAQTACAMLDREIYINRRTREKTNKKMTFIWESMLRARSEFVLSANIGSFGIQGISVEEELSKRNLLPKWYDKYVLYIMRSLRRCDVLRRCLFSVAVQKFF
jgi:glycosyltransferase involved in cell wall biosynthesis